MVRRAPSLTLLPLLFALCLPAPASEQSYPDGLRPPLDRVLAQAGPDELIPVSVVLAEQVGPERIALARAGRTRDEARRAVLGLLESTARGSQTPLLARLRVQESQGRVARIRPLWIGNVIGVDATPEVIRAIAARDDVAWVNHNPKVDVSLGARSDDFGSEPTSHAGPEASTSEIECGVDLMRAPEIWNDLNLTGNGAVIAVIDSGVCWTHADIANQVWVNPGEDLDGDGAVMDPDDMNGIDDDGNGFVDDLVGWNFDAGNNQPSDTNSHGSHVAGTVAGDGTSGTQAGMAPDARIMIVKVGLQFSDEVDVWSAMQYAADNGADAISMSLGWPHNQNPDRATWRQNCENTIDAGTAMVIAAGNEGQGNEPDNVRTPGDVPRIISVGAVDCSQNAASFTSRGPVTWQDVDPFFDHPYPPGLVKPDVSGPGVSTVSHNVCSGYSTKSGTSMATPHVAGAVALMMSANPGLSHDEIKQVLMDTAVDLGPAGLDNTYGAGMVDAFEAVSAVFGLSFESLRVVDDDADHANGDGGIDTGEVIQLAVTLHNQWDDQPATGVRGWLTTETPGVTLVHDWGEWPDVDALGSAESLAPHFSLRVDQGCNYPIQLTLHLSYSGRESRAGFTTLVGTAFDRTLIDDDFEADNGWTVATSAVTGGFVREDPNGVSDMHGPVQPEDDVTAAPGVAAWITGNDDAFPGDDDVDNGDTVLLSPVVDATDFQELMLSYSRWFTASPGSVPPSDFFRVQWTHDGGSNWTTLEELTLETRSWVAVSMPLPATAFGPGLQVRFQVDDPGPFESFVEGGVDDVTIDGRRVECDGFSPPVVDAPNGVGDTLTVNRTGDEVRLDWMASPVDATHAAATLYRVYRSGVPDAGFTVEGLSTETWHVEPREALDPADRYFLIVAENGGGTSNDVP